eukprot:scaffold15916_cov67-Skeletonema_marinoi.AAC.2
MSLVGMVKCIKADGAWLLNSCSESYLVEEVCRHCLPFRSPTFFNIVAFTMSSPKRAEDIPSCWLCLEEGPDEGGAPLVRDCSCRGSSGFAHLSCIVKYAESAGKRLYEREGPSACMDPFNICPNCKQYYQNDVHKALAKACVDFVEEGLFMMKNSISSATIYAGVALAKALLDERRTIEAEMLLSNLVDISRRTHGHEHRSTKSVLSVLTSARERKVVVRLDDVSGWFQALRYENEGEDCVVQGPIAFERNVDEEEQYSFESTRIIPFPGTPVVCHGLQKAAHLNGKIGDVWDIDVKEKEDGSKYFDVDTDRCVVHFEDKSLNLAPVKVKATNLRVVFDLPNPNADADDP